MAPTPKPKASSKSAVGKKPTTLSNQTPKGTKVKIAPPAVPWGPKIPKTNTWGPTRLVKPDKRIAGKRAN